MPSKRNAPTSPGARRALARAWPAVLLVAVLAACTSPGVPAARPSPSLTPYTLKVLSGSNLGDMAPILREAAAATGVTVRLTQVPSLVGTQTVLDGKADGVYDATWFASENYLRLSSSAAARYDGSAEIMGSPVILGLRAEAARRLGWDRTPVTWADIARAASQGRFTFGMADPAKTHAGLSALVAVATAVAGHGSALRREDIPRVSAELSGLFHAQVLKADSADWLTGAYLRQLRGGQRPVADGLITYESELIAFNRAAPPEQLVLVYPSDGVITATYPLSLLASAPAAKDAYQRLTRYLRTPRVQDEIMRVTHRRPIIGGVALTPDLAGHRPFQLPFPASLATVDELVGAYRGRLRRPGRTIYVLDTSGSMEGRRLAALKRALSALTGADDDLAARLSRFETREQVTFLPFATVPGRPVTFRIPARAAGPVLARIRRHIADLRAGGGTAAYDAVVAAYRIIRAQHAEDPARIESVVLLTDGRRTDGLDLAGFTRVYRRFPEGAPPLFAVVFGDSRRAEMRRLAELTGGLAFDAAPASLAEVFQRIRGYQ
ncbi:VWA domain-containing protein [Sphaerisporangium krabiense]|uniref:Ca-activated chloride channel family protein n=1 Tax=Sphaerisporangium krabiense TaxID=763782 RepID=A0A7W8Z5F5_9ACTN|nr:VWA domain-containing protein [Sphaerisporangium krabiense]MBB5627731.1 Ca-activated chloride channel family protein [Sphaerisporangium krabiense]GII61889.1 VWA domain-containing protein [Sphaerisporangium krabiense]